MKFYFFFFFSFKLFSVFLLLNLLTIQKTVSNSVQDNYETEILAYESDSLRIQALFRLFKETKSSEKEKALSYINEAVELAKKNQDNSELGYAYHLLGGLYYAVNDFSEAEYYFEKSIQKKILTNDSIGIAKSTRRLGVINSIRGEYAIALEFTTNALRIFIDFGDTLGMSDTYNDLGVFYDKQDEQGKALDYYMQAIEMRKLAGHEHDVAQLYNNVAIIYAKWEEFNQSMNYFERAILYARDNNEINLLGALYINVGRLHDMMENYTKAGNYYMLSMEIKEQVGDYWGRAFLYFAIGDNFVNQGIYDSAYEAYRNSIEICEQMEMKELLMQNYEQLSYLMELKGDYKKAYEYHKIYMDAFITLSDKESRERISELESSFEDQRKAVQIDLLKKEKEFKETQIARSRKYITVLIVVIALAIASFIMAMYAYKEKVRVYRIAESLNNELEDRVNNEVDANRKKDIILAQQNKQAVMGEMINSIAHQWRQPLNSLAIIIQNFDEAYKFGDINEKYINEKVDKSMGLIKFMDETIDDFRYFFKPNKTKETFSIIAAVKKTLVFSEESFKKQGITIFVDDEEEVFAKGYPSEYSQVVLNVLNNCKDVLVEKQVIDPWIKITLSKKQKLSLLTIEDNAGGINPDNLDKIFDPYFTTKENMGGTGLGLYISKIIIEKNLNGRISAINTEYGAKFYILV